MIMQFIYITEIILFIELIISIVSLIRKVRFSFILVLYCIITLFYSIITRHLCSNIDLEVIGNIDLISAVVSNILFVLWLIVLQIKEKDNV
jgi:hypothetical protein